MYIHSCLYILLAERQMSRLPSAPTTIPGAAFSALKGDRKKAAEAVAETLKDFPQFKVSGAIRRYEDPGENFAPAYKKWALERMVPGGFPTAALGIVQLLADSWYR